MFPLGENSRVDRILSLEDVNSDFWDSSDHTYSDTKTIVYLGLSNPEWSLTGLLYRLYIVPVVDGSATASACESPQVHTTAETVERWVRERYCGSTNSGARRASLLIFLSLLPSNVL